MFRLDCMGSKPVENLIEASDGVQISGLHLNGVGEKSSRENQKTISAKLELPRQPFVIGTLCLDPLTHLFLLHGVYKKTICFFCQQQLFY